MMIPVLPGVLWLGAAALLLLLLLVIFGYHLYQRSRLTAIVGDHATAGELAAKKEQLEADVIALRATLLAQKDELQKLEAERHSQELMRVDLAQLERKLEERKRESASSLKHAAELDLLVARKRNLLSRLEAEIKTLEERRKSLESVRQEMNNLEAGLEQGKIRLGIMAEQEIRCAAMKRQADNLADEQEALRVELGPLREEKQKLHQFIMQARQAAAVKNEQILEQNAHMRQLELAVADLETQLRESREEKTKLAGEIGEVAEELQKLEKKRSDLQEAIEQGREEAGQLASEAALQKNRVLDLREQSEALSAGIMRLEARRANLEAESGRVAIERKRREPRSRPGASAKGAIWRKPARVEQIFAPAGAEGRNE